MMEAFILVWWNEFNLGFAIGLALLLLVFFLLLLLLFAHLLLHFILKRIYGINKYRPPEHPEQEV